MNAFMFDAELTGPSYRSDMILEIALLELLPVNSIYKPGRYYRRCIRYSLPLQGDFARRHHAMLYEECRQADSATNIHVRESIIEFFEACGSRDPSQRLLIGSRLEGQKLYAMGISRFLEPPEVLDFADRPRKVGDYGGVLDLHAFKAFFQDTMEWDEGKLKAVREELGLAHEMPQGRRHQALYDCFHYLKQLNEYRILLLCPWEVIRQ